MKTKSSGPHSRIVIDDEGKPVGQALHLANGRWAPFDIDEKRLVEISVSFKTPAKVATFFRMMLEK